MIARVEAVSICSSDLKIIRLGTHHPLFSSANGPVDTVLGHEVCLRVHQVGTALRDRFRPGQRLALQPAMRLNGKRVIVGMDRPGGFAQFLRLGPDELNGYVFEAPETLPAAAIAMLEPYGCVERAYRPTGRSTLCPQRPTLIVLGKDADSFGTAEPPIWPDLTVLEAGAVTPPAFLDGLQFKTISESDLARARFDDIIALGELDADTLALLPPCLADGGLLLQARRTLTPPVAIDPVRIHYDALSFVGTTEADFLDALRPEHQRFEVKPGGVALVHGAGGAMGRIHVHRLLQLEDGPSMVIATSRKGARLEALKADFEPVADRQKRTLIVCEGSALSEAVAAYAPHGIDDAVVVAPDVSAVSAAAAALAPDGLLAVFAGFPYGDKVPFDLSGVAVSGKRLTGSTGCSVADMQGVLSRAMSGKLNLTENIKGVAGIRSLPEALAAVSDGSVAGKVVLYPQTPELPFRGLTDGWIEEEEADLTGADHQSQRI